MKRSFIDHEVALIHKTRLIKMGAVRAVSYGSIFATYGEVIINQGGAATMFEYRLKYGDKERYTRGLQLAGAIRKTKLLAQFISCDEDSLIRGDRIVLQDEAGEEIKSGKISRFSYYEPYQEDQAPVIVEGQNRVVFNANNFQGQLVEKMKEAMEKASPDEKNSTDTRYRILLEYCTNLGINPNELTIDQLKQLNEVPEWEALKSDY